MCEFCILFDYSMFKANVNNGVATIVKAPSEIPFLPKDQFNFCPVCGSPRESGNYSTSTRFPENLRRIRRMRGVTQDALGRSIGVGRSAICKYEKGRSRPNITQLSELCRYLDVSPQELV